jgi:hypothetical protein
VIVIVVKIPTNINIVRFFLNIIHQYFREV